MKVQAIHERQNGEPIRAKGSRIVTVPVIYTLADGREVESNHTQLTQAEAAELVARLPRDIDQWFHAEDVEQAINDKRMETT